MIHKTLFDHAQQTYDWWQKSQQAYATLKRLQHTQAGATPFEVMAQFGKVRLLKFTTDTKPTLKTPLLISYALVNRFTIADLQEGKSTVARLLATGVPVYIVDWGYPNPGDRHLDLDDYINDYLDACVREVARLHNCASINLLGICQGGTFSICYTAMHPARIKNLITMVTPVNFHTERDMLSHMANAVDAEAFVAAFGNIKGEFLNINFNMLQPVKLGAKKWLDSVYALSDEGLAQFYLNMERWIKDSPDQAGAAYAEFIGNFYQQNRLINGGLVIGDMEVAPGNITQPVLNVFGTEDHLVPPESSKALAGIIGAADYTEAEIKTGHIGMYVSRHAKAVPERIAEWLAARDA